MLSHKAELKPLLSLFLPHLIGNFLFLITEYVNRMELAVMGKKFHQRIGKVVWNFKSHYLGTLLPCSSSLRKHHHWFPNDVWKTSAKLPFWWRVTTQIWKMLLIGWSKFSANQKHYPDLGTDSSSIWNFCASDVTSWGNHSVVLWSREKSAVFSGFAMASSEAFLNLNTSFNSFKTNTLFSRIAV